MKTIYISGPMSGILDWNKPAFAEAKRRLQDTLVIKPINPHEKGLPEDAPWEEHLKVDIRLLTYCDGVALLPGWERSKGAKLEHHIATALNIPVKNLEEWLV